MSQAELEELKPNICICEGCNESAPYTWFCPFHTQVKEAAYAKSRLLGENFYEVIARRDKALRDSIEERTCGHS